MISWLQESENGALLAMDIRVLNSSAQPFYAAIECPAGCVGKVDISSQLRSDEFSEWQSFAIPLQCFAQQSASLGRISNPLVLQTEGKWTVELSTVRIVSSTQEMLRRFECTQHE
jgi:beta-glucosidase